MNQIAKETLQYRGSLSTGNIRLPKRIFIVFTMVNAKASIRAGAYLEICAPYWLFPIIEAYKSNDSNFREKFYLLVSSLVHEMEHASNTEETIEDAFNDNEHVTTFAEYLAIPMLVTSRHESEYLPTIKNYLIFRERGKNFYHASAFYMTLTIFVDYIRGKPEFKDTSELSGFPSMEINEKFYVLINLKKILSKQKKLFINYALECREKIYRARNYEIFLQIFRQSEKNLNMENLVLD